MPKYGCSSLGFTTATTDKTAVYVNCNTAGDEAEIVELALFGSGGSAAADTTHRASAVFNTGATDGTGTAQTPEPFHQGSGAALPTVTVNHSAEPTTKNSVFPVLFGFNQRGGMRWSVPRGEGLTVRNGDTDDTFAWQVMSSAAGETDGHLHFWNP